MSAPRPGGLRLPVRPHPTDPLIAVLPLPHWLTIDKDSVLEDEDGRPYAYASPQEFERLALTDPLNQRRFTPRGAELHVLPPDTTMLYLKQ